MSIARRDHSEEREGGLTGMSLQSVIPVNLKCAVGPYGNRETVNEAAQVLEGQCECMDRERSIQKGGSQGFA